MRYEPPHLMVRAYKKASKKKAKGSCMRWAAFIPSKLAWTLVKASESLFLHRLIKYQNSHYDIQRGIGSKSDPLVKIVSTLRRTFMAPPHTHSEHVCKTGWLALQVGKQLAQLPV